MTTMTPEFQLAFAAAAMPVLFAGLTIAVATKMLSAPKGILTFLCLATIVFAGLAWFSPFTDAIAAQQSFVAMVLRYLTIAAVVSILWVWYHLWAEKRSAG